ncbi:MAG: hypothetical protein WAW17_01045 [Rhodococcus sp. (in: high G+C Gram-positive bacteria)]
MEPHPSGFAASAAAEWSFFFIAGAAVVIFALPWAIKAATNRNWTPLLVIGSGLLCCLLEPMLDILGHLHWANNLTTAFTNFGVPVPALIPLCYVAFLGLQAYFSYFVIRNGAHRNHFFMLLAMGLMLDAVMETIGINLGVYEYYGLQPFELFNFPYWWGFINGGSFVTVGVILAYAVPRLHGPGKLLLLLAAPTGMMVNYFGVGWVHILAHNSTLPDFARWIATAVMMVMMVGWMAVLHHLVGRKESDPAPKWTLGRMFLYTVLPRAKRAELWKKMLNEGGVTPDDGIALNPEEPGVAVPIG